MTEENKGRASSGGPAGSLRGSVIRDARSWILATHGAEVFDRALSRLPPEERDAWTGTILAAGWYSVEAWTSILAEIAANVQLPSGRPQSEFYLQLVRESGSRTLKTVYKFVLELLSPQTVINRIPMLFARLYSEGVFEVVENDPGRALLRYRGASPIFRDNIRQMFHTSIIAILELNGVRDIQTSVARDEIANGKLVYEVAVRYRAS